MNQEEKKWKKEYIENTNFNRIKSAQEGSENITQGQVWKNLENFKPRRLILNELMLRDKKYLGCFDQGEDR